MEVESNLQNEQFGVEELADRMSMSRSHLHRKLKQATGQSVNQFIREYRLQRAMELLKQEDKTVSEVAYEVGFGSPSYFTTCFAEYYGYPPGEVKYRIHETPQPDNSENQEKIYQPDRPVYNKKIIWGSLIVFGVLLAFFLYQQIENYTNKPSTTATSQDKSIAVLPFKNLNADQENEYFSEGVEEAINRSLSRIDELRVISLTSTDRYRESDKSAQEIASELEVSNLLEGSIQRHENTVRIEMRLIDAITESQIWAENYDRELKDIFKTQSEIAEQVALALKATLSPQEKAVLNQKTTDDTEAYDLYLKGLYECRTYTRNGIQQSMNYFEQAIALDSGFALAYAGLAESYILRASIFVAESSPMDAMPLAKPLLDKALALDPDLIEAHLWNGFYLLYHNWDFEGAEQAYKKAIVENHPDALGLYADFLNFTRRHDEALTIAQRLNQTNPFYPGSRMILALYYAGRPQEAAAFAQSRLKLINSFYLHDNYGFLLLNTDQYQEAISLFQSAMDNEGFRYPRMLCWMGAAYGRSGQTEKAQDLIEELKSKRAQNDAGSLAFFIAVIYAALNDKPSSLNWLQIAYEQHEMEIPWLISEPQFYSLHDEPEFQALVTQVGFP